MREMKINSTKRPVQNIHSSISYNSFRLETQMPIDRRMTKQRSTTQQREKERTDLLSKT